jgi:hypothetical protein
LKRLLLIGLVCAFAVPAQSQVRRRVPQVPAPSAWVSLSAGLFSANDVSDGATNSNWAFGQSYTPQYRASFEKAISNTASVGLTGTFVHAPFIYSTAGFVDDGIGAAQCARCDAHMNIASIGASFHYGGGIGLHQVIEASAGALQYRDLKRDSDGAELAPSGGNVDPYFTFGYGFGWAINPVTQVSVVQDLGLALHERSGLTSDQSNTLRHRSIRLNLRYGFGNKVRRR